MLMLVVRCGGVRKNRKRGFVVFRNCRWALDFGAMLRAGDFSEIWQEPDVHNSFSPRFTGRLLARTQFCAKTPSPKFGVKFLCIIHSSRQ